jgi:hypothetical protein
MRPFLPLLLTAFGASIGSLPAQTAVAPAVTKAAETITPEDVGRHINVIAHDSMLGRNTPSPGLEMTAQYIADQFKQFGLKPAGDSSGGWLQRYPLRGNADVTAPNTVGILEGTDPKLKNEYIVFSAHMDHVGYRKGSTAADSISNGADDDASGTTGIIELAEAFSRPGARPRRSMIFLTVSGEEKGLWGSSYFAAHPPVPVEQMVANINLDMIGRNWKDTIVAIGKEHSDLGATLERVVAAHPELNMKAIDDIWPNERFYFRSDHYNFARRGVPILFFQRRPRGLPPRLRLPGQNRHRKRSAAPASGIFPRPRDRQRRGAAEVERGELSVDRQEALSWVAVKAKPAPVLRLDRRPAPADTTCRWRNRSGRGTWPAITSPWSPRPCDIPDSDPTQSDC